MLGFVGGEEILGSIGGEEMLVVEVVVECGRSRRYLERGGWM